MEVNNLESGKKELLLSFFKDNFGINLEEYDDKKISAMINLVSSEINKVIEEETKKNVILSEMMEKQKSEIEELLNNLKQYWFEKNIFNMY